MHRGRDAEGDTKATRDDFVPCATPDEQEVGQPECEQAVFAEHRAALDATLFARDPTLDLELRDGILLRR